jgi:hypothetical protein
LVERIASDIASSLHGAVDVVLRSGVECAAAIEPSSRTPIRLTPPSEFEKATAVFCSSFIDVARLNSTCWLLPGKAARNSVALIVNGRAARDSG